ncbi:MAG: alanyl-tRNA editing protein, partial [Sphaerochaetaceae bacterium]|nr:alanyl-tRNA editing protein [Sphaerochaetaceae bacterium]
MHVTEKTYYDLPYERELTVRVVDIITDGKHKAVVLDKTIFYPEGGGQPGDMGWLGTYEIIDTQKKNDGTIEHVLSEGDVPEIGKEYRLMLNWSHRYDFMQQHTAQHLISGILYSSASIGTVSVHFGKDLFTIETDADEIEPTVLLAVEDKVNEIIRTHVPLQVKTATREEADTMGLRREVKVDN